MEVAGRACELVSEALVGSAVAVSLLDRGTWTVLAEVGGTGVGGDRSGGAGPAAQASLRRSDSRTALAAAESLRTASETMGATALAAACAALHTAGVETGRAFLPSLLLHSQQLQDEMAPYTDPAAVCAAMSGARV